MALVLNEEQTMLKDAARDFLRQRAPISHLRQLRDNADEKGFSPELWQEMAEMGWAGIPIPEAYGGLAYGYVGMGIVLEEIGRSLTPSPLLSTCLLGATAITLGAGEQQKQDLLPRIASGELLAAFAVDEGAHHRPNNCQTTAVKTDSGWTLSGRKTNVIDGHNASYLIVTASVEGHDSPQLFLVATDDESVERSRSLLTDIHSTASIQFNDMPISADSHLGQNTPGLCELVLDIGRIGIAAEMLGIAQEAFERTLDYLKERKQFGTSIGAFQALQHRAALGFAEIELTKSVVLKALQAIDAADQKLPVFASLAKSKAGQTAQLICNEAIQMHGGIGMTDEFDIGFFIKRAKVLQHALGDNNFHYDRFAKLRGY